VVDSKLGTKRVCESCGAKFYDLNNSPAICPKCGHSFDPLAALADTKPVKEIAPQAEAPEEDDEDALEEDDTAISLDDIVEEEDDSENETALPDFEDAPLDDDDEDGEDALLDTDDDDDSETFLPEETDDD